MKINVENLFVDIELKITDKKHRIQVLELNTQATFDRSSKTSCDYETMFSKHRSCISASRIYRKLPLTIAGLIQVLKGF